MCNIVPVTILPLGEARNRFPAPTEAIGRPHDRPTMTRHGQLVAMVLSPEYPASMEETLAIYAVPDALDAVREVGWELDSGQVADWEKFRAALGK